MSHSCPLCGKRKAKRACRLQRMARICSFCCAATCGARCGDCAYYVAAEDHRAAKRGSPARHPYALPGGGFLAETTPELDDAVGDALTKARTGGTDRALAVLTDLLREHPRSHLVHFGIGVVHAITGDDAEATRWFEQAVAMYPRFAEAHFNLAVSYQKQLDVGRAIRAYRKVVEVGEPGSLEVNRAGSFLDQMAETIRETEGVDLDAYVEALTEFERAFAQMQEGDWQGALDGFRASAARNDRNAPCHGNMGLCLAQLGYKSQALAELDRALAIDPQYAPALANRATIEAMQEGCPLSNVSFQTVNFSLERFLGKRSRRG